MFKCGAANDDDDGDADADADRGTYLPKSKGLPTSFLIASGSRDERKKGNQKKSTTFLYGSDRQLNGDVGQDSLLINRRSNEYVEDWRMRVLVFVLCVAGIPNGRNLMNLGFIFFFK